MTDPGRPFDLDERSVVPAATASDLGHENPLEDERREEAFGNLALFGRSPFVPEWRHHIPPPDPASCAAFAALVEVA